MNDISYEGLGGRMKFLHYHVASRRQTKVSLIINRRLLVSLSLDQGMLGGGNRISVNLYL